MKKLYLMCILASASYGLTMHAAASSSAALWNRPSVSVDEAVLAIQNLYDYKQSPVALSLPKTFNKELKYISGIYNVAGDKHDPELMIRLRRRFEKNDDAAYYLAIIDRLTPLVKAKEKTKKKRCPIQ